MLQKHQQSNWLPFELPNSARTLAKVPARFVSQAPYPNAAEIVMFHSSIANSYDRQQRLFKRLISLAFSLAGVYWLVMYGLQWSGHLSHADIQVLRSGQSIIYFVLLTLWGVEYLRESRRLKAAWAVANERRCPPQDVTAEDLRDTSPSFGVLWPVGFGKRSFVLPAVNWIGLVASTIMIGLQYLRLVTLAMGIDITQP